MTINTISEKDIVAYFDFDGTLTTKDTLVPFVLYATGWIKFILNLPRICIVVFLYLFKFIDNENAKERFLTIMLKGVSEDNLELEAKNFSLTKLDKYIKPEIYTKLEYHQEHKHNVILISANLAIYLRYWIKKHSLTDVIATEIEFINGVTTGRLATRNCYGEQKNIRLKKYLADKNLNFVYSYGYGNSAGDFELLKAVDEGYWVTDGTIISWEEYTNGL